MAKSYDDVTNETLRALARKVMRERFEDKQVRLAEGLDLSTSFVSEFLNQGRGAGLEMLVGLAKFAPLETLSILGIEPELVVLLLSEKADGWEGLMALPDIVRRAARACIELTGCTPGEAGDAAVEAFETHGAVPGTDTDWWLTKIRGIVSGRAKSGERLSARLLTAGKQQES